MRFGSRSHAPFLALPTRTVRSVETDSAAEREVFRLSSKSHWDVPLRVGGEVVHFLVSHPTPPVFDGPDDVLINTKVPNPEIVPLKVVVPGAFMLIPVFIESVSPVVTFNVPERNPLSCPPPSICGNKVTRGSFLLTYNAPIPFGP